MTANNMAANKRELKTRIISAFVMIMVSFGVIWVGNTIFLAFLIILSSLMAWEWSRIAMAKSKLSWLVMAITIGLSLILFTIGYSLFEIVITLSIGAVVAFMVEWQANIHIKFLIFAGVFYIALALLTAIWLRAHNDGIILFFWLAAMVVATDIGAYFSGRSIGGAKLAVKISPNKTWAGLFGGMIAAAIVSAIFAYNMTSNISDIYYFAVLAMVIAAIAQMGDLLESWMKRKSNHKDSSNMIPGHGGVLDRFDGFLAATPVFAFYINYANI